MRNREEIEKANSYRLDVEGYARFDIEKATLEVLLDIRELLQNGKEWER